MDKSVNDEALIKPEPSVCVLFFQAEVSFRKVGSAFFMERPLAQPRSRAHDPQRRRGYCEICTVSGHIPKRVSFALLESLFAP